MVSKYEQLHDIQETNYILQTNEYISTTKKHFKILNSMNSSYVWYELYN